MRTSKSHAISPSKVRKVCEITTECRALTNVLYAYQEIVNIAFEHKTPKVGTFRISQLRGLVQVKSEAKLDLLQQVSFPNGHMILLIPDSKRN